MSNTRKTGFNIIVNLTFDAVHQWPDCNMDDVAFLEYPHRHLFHITCKRPVEHADRQVEILIFKRGIEEFLNDTFPRTHNGNGPHDIGGLSCEALAALIADAMDCTYCAVLEDGENGAEYEKGGDE